MSGSRADLESRAAGWQAAIEQRDAAAADGFLDPGYQLVLVVPVRLVVPRAQWLDTLPGYVVHEYEVLERVVDVDGDVGLLLQSVRMRATVRGDDRSGLFILSDAWRLRDGLWRVWRRHSTPLAGTPMPS